MNTRGLTDLGCKIFLDRYALKDTKRETLKPGDLVLVKTDDNTGQKEIGELVRLEGSKAIVILHPGTDASESIDVDVEHVDKPLELDPADMWNRVALAMAEQEQTSEKFEEWLDKFKWLLEDWKFLPGGRILAAAGTGTELTYFNCYVIPSPKDSKDDIFKSVNDMAQLMAVGGGVGVNISSLRPRYAHAKRTNGRSSGAVSWGELYSYTTGLIEQGGSRRGALLLMLNDWHPDILEYINVKRDNKRIINANISVAISEEFVDAVENDMPWELMFPDTNHPNYDTEWDGDLRKWRSKGYTCKVWKNMPARELWNAITDSAWACAEPGLWFVDRVNRYSNSHYYAPLISTNPCVTGDTMVAVADGRNAVPIKQLAEENSDVPVYCYASSDGVTISTGRNPRITGRMEHVWKVTLDDGSHIKTTINHRFLMRDGSYKKLQDLKCGDSLMPYKKYRMNRQKNCGGHWYIWTDYGATEAEHRMIMEFILGRKLLPYPEEVAHHDNEDSLDNSWGNLILMSHSEHTTLHQSGDDNVMRDKWWNKLSDEEREYYRQHMSDAVSGDKNGMYGKQHSDSTKKLIGTKRSEAWDRATEDEREQFAKNVANGIRIAIEEGRWIPYERTPEILAKLSQSLMKPRVAVNCLVCGHHKSVTEDYLNTNPIKAQTCSDKCYNTALTGKSSETRLSEAARAYANTPEGKLAKSHAARAGHINSASKQAKWMLDNSIPIEQWDEYRKTYKQETGNYALSYEKAKELVEDLELAGANYNHVVKSIEYAGVEDVYNITVDNHHTVAYVTAINDNYTGIITANCGEISLPEWGCCNLGAINLSKFVGKGTDSNKVAFMNWNGLQKAVRYAVRFLDNVIDATPYAYEEIKQQQLSERRIGLGTMGLAEVLIRLKLRYGSEESLKFIDELYQFIAVNAYEASIELAEERGSFPKFDLKILDSEFMKNMPEPIQLDVKKYGLRNVTLLTQAPTGTIGTMVNTSTGIEPFYFWQYERKGRLGSHTERVKVYDEWLANHIDNIPDNHTLKGFADKLPYKLPDWFVTAQDLTPEEHVRVQAAIQKWVDSSISKTCNVPEDYTVEQIGELYKLMYELGCKGGTVYRDKSRDEQILNLKKDTKPYKYTESEDKTHSGHSSAPSNQLAWRSRPADLAGNTYRKNTAIGTAYITVNRNGTGEPFETFIAVGKAGSDVQADAEGIGRLISLILRMPSPLSATERIENIAAQLSGIGSGKQHGFGKQRVMSLPDAVAQVLVEHTGITGGLPNLPEYSEPKTMHYNGDGDICPGCGNASLMRVEGCQKCYGCGYSQC